MKFKYNGKTYVVFADIEEVEKKEYIVKINDDYLFFLPEFTLRERVKRTYFLNKTLSTEITITQVLKYVSNSNKILLAHEIKATDKVVDTIYADSLSGELTDSLELFMRLSKQYNKAKVTFVSDCSNEYYVITSYTEETEEEAKTRLGCNWNKVKYYEP